MENSIIIPTMETTSSEQLLTKTNLVYTTDTIPGIRRIKKGKGFSYILPNGKPLTNKQHIAQIEHLVIPPAWKDVWISPNPQGHLQAIGRDEKGRKQYRYHPEWILLSQQHKFQHMLAFSSALAEMRKEIASSLSTGKLTKERVLALIIWLLDNTYIRIGNEEYARENKHYGLTTLRNKHIDIHGNTVKFHFVGKSGKTQAVSISHPKVVKTIRKLEELPGFELFQYIDEQKNIHQITSQDVNAYLKSLAGNDVSAKDFRTWGGSTLAATTLYTIGESKTQKEIKQNITTAVKTVAKHLGNTPTVSRKYYIHPTIPQTYQDNILIAHFTKVLKDKIHSENLTKEELALQTLLKTYQGKV